MDEVKLAIEVFQAKVDVVNFLSIKGNSRVSIVQIYTVARNLPTAIGKNSATTAMSFEGKHRGPERDKLT